MYILAINMEPLITGFTNNTLCSHVTALSHVSHIYFVLPLLGPGLPSMSFDCTIIRDRKKTERTVMVVYDGLGRCVGNFLRIKLRNILRELTLYLNKQSVIWKYNDIFCWDGLVHITMSVVFVKWFAR